MEFGNDLEELFDPTECAHILEDVKSALVMQPHGFESWFGSRSSKLFYMTTNEVC
jgi:hypothetical protein